MVGTDDRGESADPTGGTTIATTHDARTAAALAAYEHTDDAILVVTADPDGEHRVVEANRTIEHIAGFKREDVLGQPLAKVQPPPLFQAFRRHLDEVLATGNAIDYQIEHETPTGRRSYQVTLCPAPQPDSDPAHVVSVVRDGTAIRRVTETLSELQQVADIGYWTWDMASGGVRWSQQLYRIFGMAPGEFEATFANYLACIHEDDRERVKASIQHTRETGEPFDFEHRIVTPDGETRRLHCRGQQIRNQEGRPVRLTGTARRIDDTP